MKVRSIAKLFIPLWAVAACSSEPPPVTPAPPEPPAAAAPAASAPPPAPVEAPKVEAPKLPPVEVKPAELPAALDKLPKVTISAPKANESIAADKAAAYEVKLEVKDWPVAQNARHVHLILDNLPYKPIYEPTATIKLGDIVAGASLAEGQHVLVAFPSRENHLSVKPEKGKSPLAVVSFWIGKAGKPTWKPTDPTLIYSRPKGAYDGAKADSILLDWYLANVELGEKKYSLKATITPPTGDAKSMSITDWAPLSILNLPNGDTKIKLELLDKDGKAVPGGWNSTERTITVNRDAK